jgi:SAM-dependent methyltransferase
MDTLAQIYDRHKAPGLEGFGDKGTIHSYIDVYSRLLEPYRRSARNVLEIGILSGMSLLMWEEFFGDASVYGVDLCERPVSGRYDLGPLIRDGHKIRLFDATDPVQVASQFPTELFDVVVEDASHVFEHQIAAYNNFRDRLSPGGIYVIEDVADLDKHRGAFEAIDPSRRVDVFDLRSVKGRFDDVLVTITDQRARQ